MNSPEDAVKSRLASLCLDETHQGRRQWNHWGMYLDRALTLSVVDRLASIVEQHRDEFDLLCAIPTSGFPLAAMLFQRLLVPHFASFHWTDQTFHAEDRLKIFTENLGRAPRICTVDSSIQTGLSLFLCDQMVRDRLKGDVVLAVSILNNDIEPEPDPIKEQFEKLGKLKYLWRLSELPRTHSAITKARPQA